VAARAAGRQRDLLRWRRTALIRLNVRDKDGRLALVGNPIYLR